MFRAFIVFAALVLPALADEATKTAKIEELLAISSSKKLMDQQLDAMDSMLQALMEKMELSSEGRNAAKEMMTEMSASMRRNLNWEKTKPVFSRIYAETFTEEEIEGMLGFYKTPAGQAMLAKMPMLMTKTMQEMGGLVSEFVKDIQKRAEELSNRYPANKQ